MSEEVKSGQVKFIGASVVKVTPIVNVTDSFKKRTIVISLEGQYTSYVEAEVLEKSFDYVSDLKPGDIVDVSAWVGGRSWQKTPAEPVKYFNSIRLSYVKKVGGSQNNNEQPAMPEVDNALDDAGSDDLPF